MVYIPHLMIKASLGHSVGYSPLIVFVWPITERLSPIGLSPHLPLVRDGVVLVSG